MFYCVYLKDLQLIVILGFQQYADIWALDEKDPFMRPQGGESVADVLSRLTSALMTIEKEFQGYCLFYFFD